jgi:CCR4-NOT transcription complex subunit 1
MCACTGLVEKSELLLREWIRLYLTHGTPKDSNKAFTSFINELNISGILKSDDVITRFFRISVQCCVNQVYQGLQVILQDMDYIFGKDIMRKGNRKLN